jgi:tetratricopeptide (TPR) repeat protein
MRTSRIPEILASAALAAILLPAQVVAPKGGTPTGTTGTTGSPSSPTLPSTRGAPTDSTTTNPDAITRGTFFYGKVVMPDGTAPPSQVVIERVCGATSRPQAYTDSKGNFSFQVGQTQDMLPDATTSRASTAPGNPSDNSPNSKQTSQFSSSNCDLRASLGGYRSDNVSLAGRRSLDDPNVGTIFLHRLSNIEGLTMSATSSLAPKDAHKAFDKGLEAVKKSKWDEAETAFLKAGEIYPHYASAWYEVGRVYEQRERLSDAREAYTKAIAADSKFVNPYEHLYMIALKEQKWEEVASTTDRVMHLNPYDFPLAVYYNAVANIQLNKLDVAEKSAREAESMNGATRNPKINYVLGVILAKKQDFRASAAYLRAYLKSDAILDRDHVSKMLADIEKQARATAELKPEP